MRPQDKIRTLDDETIRKLALAPGSNRPDHGLVGAARGEYTERRVALLALQCPGVKSVRRGTRYEDHERGIDLVVGMCSGEFKLLQVKSSRSKSGKARAAAAKAMRNGAEIVCVPINMSDADAKRRIMIALGLTIPHPATTHECTFETSQKSRGRVWQERRRSKLRTCRHDKRMAHAMRLANRPFVRALMRWEDDGGQPAPEAESKSESI